MGRKVSKSSNSLKKLKTSNLSKPPLTEGGKALQGSIDAFGADNLLTAMVPNLDGVDPDDAFSSVPYEKGCGLLTYIEQKMGGPSVMESWFKAYVEKFSYTTATTSDWKDFLYNFFSNQPEKVSILDQVDWEMWFHQAGMPTQMPTFDDTLEQECIKIAHSWRDPANTHSLEEYTHLNTLQKIILFGHLEKDESLNGEVFLNITNTWQMEKVQNSEVRFQWCMFGIRTGNEMAYEAGSQMVRDQGRMKFTRPLFKSLNKMHRDRTVALFQEIRQFMHPTTEDMVSKDLGLAN